MLKWLFGRKEAAPQKETNTVQAAPPAAPAVEPAPTPAPAPAPAPAPVAAVPSEPAPAPEPTPAEAGAPAAAPSAPPPPAAEPEPVPAAAPPVAAATAPAATAPSLSSADAPKAALLKQSLSLLADGADVEPKVGIDAVAVAPPLVEPAKVVKVQAGGRRVVASFGNSAKVRVYSKRADGTYRLEGAPAQSASRLIVGATA